MISSHLCQEGHRLHLWSGLSGFGIEDPGATQRAGKTSF